jgi:hypothetical protein
MQKVELGLHLLHLIVAVLLREFKKMQIVRFLISHLRFELLDLLAQLLEQLVLLLDFGLFSYQVILEKLNDVVLLPVGLLELLDLLVLFGVVFLDVRYNLLR